MKRLLSSVDFPMIGKRTVLPKLFFASITMVWFLYGVNPPMPGNITFRSKLFITHITLIKYFTRVYSPMIHKTIFVCILLIAIIILIWLLSSVYLLVSFKTTCLPKICVMRCIVYNSFIKSKDKNTKMKIECRIYTTRF